MITNNDDVEAPLIYHNPNKPLPNSSIYDPLAVPPDVDIALQHFQATRVGIIPKNTKLDLCQDCGRVVNNELVPLQGPGLERAGLGVGFTLYFQYIYFCGMMLTGLFTIFGIHELFANFTGTRCKGGEDKHDKTNPCNGGFILNSSLTNRSGSDPVQATYILGLLFTIGAYIFTLYCNRTQQKTINKFANKATTTADFTVMIRGVPMSETEEGVKDFFEEQHHKEGKNFNVKRVIFAYKVVDYMKMQEKKRKLQIARKGHPLEINYKISEIEIHMKNMRESYESKKSSYFTGVAFVTFSTKHEMQDTVKRYKLGFFKSVYYYIFKVICMTPGSLKSGLYKGKKVRLDKAPEPLDICFENLGFKRSKVLRRMLCYFFAAIVIFWGFVFTTKFDSEKSDFSSDNWIEKIIGPEIISLYIVAIGYIIEVCIRKLAHFEKHKTYTNLNISVSNKLSFIQIFNVWFTIVAAHGRAIAANRKSNLWTGDDFVSQVYYLFIFNTFLPPITALLNPLYLYKLYRRKRLLDDPKTSKLTQHRANSLFEGPEFDISLNYVRIQKTFILTGYFAALLPITIPISIIALAAQYYLDKYLLLRRCIRPRTLGSLLGVNMLYYLRIFLFAFTLGLSSAFGGSVDLGFDIQLSSLTGLTFLVIMIPQYGVKYYKNSAELDDANYDDEKMHFVTDYDRVNPLTQDEALINWMKSHKDQIKTEDMNDEERMAVAAQQSDARS